MIVFLVILHVIISLFLILVVLVQQGKGADLAGAFGGGGSQTALTSTAGSRASADDRSEATRMASCCGDRAGMEPASRPLRKMNSSPCAASISVSTTTRPSAIRQ